MHGVKTGLQALKGYSTHLKEQKSQSTDAQKSMPDEILVSQCLGGHLR
jgi:hypothetical protein